MIRLAALAALCAALAACGPPSAEVRRERCAERARLADGPFGTVGVGVGSDGVTAEGSIGITTDYLAGRSPEEVYQTCLATPGQVYGGVTVGGEL